MGVGTKVQRGTIWTGAMALALSGFIAATLRGDIISLGIMLTGGVALLFLAARTSKVRRRPLAIALMVLGAVAIITALVIRSLQQFLAPHQSLGIAGYGVLLLVASLRVPPKGLRRPMRRWIVPIIGHAFSLAGSSLILMGSAPIPPAPLLAAMFGYTLLFIDLLWMRRANVRHRQSWEAFLLLLLAASLVLGIIVAYPGLTSLNPAGKEFALESLLRLAVLAGLAMVGDPPPMPGQFNLQPGGVAEFWIDSLSTLVILESLVFLLLFAAPAVVWPLFYALTVLLLFAVTWEYASALHGMRRRRHLPGNPGALVGPLPPITLLVTSKTEADSLARTLPTNLVYLPTVQVLAAFAAPDERTTEVVETCQRLHPGRITMAPCPGLSKATDLDQAWTRIRTPYVLMLDADETIDETSLRIAVGHLEAEPGVGLVQGRKFAPEPLATSLHRFIAAERRFSTVLDHPLYADSGRAAHFAGSAALLRREVPQSVQGWRPVSLTEDIEFTMRLYLQSPWSIRYDERMLVTERIPDSFAALIRQRGRWARGWGEVFAIHIGTVLRRTRHLGFRRTIWLSRQLITAVNAPWAVFLPLLGVLWIVQGAFYQLPLWLNAALAAYILPARLFSYGMAYVLDPMRQRRGALLGWLRAVWSGYVWILLAWLLQLHALYLELSDTPRKWLRTRLDT